MAKKAAVSAVAAVAVPVAPVAVAAKKAAKPATVPAAVAAVAAPAVEKPKPGLTGNEVKIMDALRTGGTMTRPMLIEATGIAKGWSATLGAATSEAGIAADTLEGRGFVTSSKVEGSRLLHYDITKEGRIALAHAEKVIAANAVS